MPWYCNTINQQCSTRIQNVMIVGETQETVQDHATKEEDDIYSAVSNHSSDGPCSISQDGLPPHPMPYKTAVFHEQCQSANTLKPQLFKSFESKSVCDRVDENLQCVGNCSSTRSNRVDEHHVYM